MVDERRQHARVSLDTRVWVGQDGIFTQSEERLNDLSVGGAFIESPSPSCSTGDVLNVRFKLGAGFVTATAIVRNARAGAGFGVQFLDLSAEGRAAIERYVAEQRSRPSGTDP